MGNGYDIAIAHSTNCCDVRQRTMHPARKSGFPAPATGGGCGTIHTTRRVHRLRAGCSPLLGRTAVPLLARRRPVLLRFTAREPLRPLQRSPPHARPLPHHSRHSLPPPARRRPRRTPATTLETPYAGCSSLPAAASPTAPHARRPRLPAVAFPTNVTLIAPPSPTPAPLAANLRATATGRWRSSCCRGGPTPTARPPPPPPTSRGRPPPYHPPQGVARTKKAAREPVSGTSEKRRGRFGGQFFFFFRRYDWGGTYASLRRERKPDACLGCGGDHR